MENYTIFLSGRWILLLLFSVLIQPACHDLSSRGESVFPADAPADQGNLASVVPGAEQPGAYVPLLRGKRVGVVVNHASLVQGKHLLDTLLALDIDVHMIFSPEHGFRGEEADGALIDNSIDPRTGLPIISLHGRQKKPSPEHISGLDVLVFDLQDVGVRFYTYLSTLHNIMEAAAEQGKTVVVLDRPNPNGYFLDGPVLETEKFSSFIGKHPVPVVYGMTIGEYAQMINGEKWLSGGVECVLQVIPLMNYDRDKAYALKVRPSPNLPTAESVLLYPSLAFLEGTTVSIGRGTDHPFQCIGHPEYRLGSFMFTPVSRRESVDPKWKGTVCYGTSLQGLRMDDIQAWRKINLSFLLDMYAYLNERTEFFRADGYFEKLAGTDKLRKQLASGISEEDIRASWQTDLDLFKKVRSKYLLYPDFSAN